MHAQRKALVSGPPLLDESDNLVAIMRGGSTVEGSSIGKSVGISSLETTESKPSVKKPKHLSRLTNLSAKNWFQNNQSEGAVETRNVAVEASVLYSSCGRKKNKDSASKHSLATKRQSSTLQSTSKFTFLRLSARALVAERANQVM